MIEKGLYIDLSDTLRAAHNACGSYGLIGRDHHEFLYTDLHGEVGEYSCTKYIADNRFCRVTLHQWNVFISCCVEDCLRFFFDEYLLQLHGVCDVAHVNRKIDEQT